MWGFLKWHSTVTKRIGRLQIGKGTYTSTFSTLNRVTPSNRCSDIDEEFGQPVSSTHPHLINKDEFVPGIRLDEFIHRRQKLLTGILKYAKLQNIDGNHKHLVIVPSTTKKFMSDKIPYIFRQNSDFYYLTGCLEPDSILMMSIDEKSNMKSIMFVRPKDKHAELWEGPRTGVNLATELFGVDEAYSVGTAFEHEVAKRIELEKTIVWFDHQSSELQNVTTFLQKLASNRNRIESPTALIQGLRLFKSPAEQLLMRRTCEIASASINEVMSEARPGHSEHHITAMVDFKCRMRNANHLAYPPVVASGRNATTIHYISNTQVCESGDLVLMDAGCEYAGYTSDITRTWPVSGDFTEPQKVLYDLVLQLQKELIDKLLKEGGQTLDQLFDTMCFMLGKYLQEIGLVQKDITDVVGLTKAGFMFCPHHVSHYLGMDVHDTPLMPRSIKLLPGMVCTVEPGIYIQKNRTDVPKEFRGIGIRIEDDVLITNDNTVEVLTAECKKQRQDLKSLYQKSMLKI